MYFGKGIRSYVGKSSAKEISAKQSDPNYMQNLIGQDSLFNKKIKNWQKDFISSIGYQDQKIDMYAFKPNRRKR